MPIMIILDIMNSTKLKDFAYKKNQKNKLKAFDMNYSEQVHK